MQKTRKYFKKYQTPALCNLGTAFGMGMIVCTFMLGLGTAFLPAVAAGLGGCVIGSIISTRLMQFFTKRHYVKEGVWEEMLEMEEFDSPAEPTENTSKSEEVKKKGLFSRVMDCLLEGGKLGWQICFATTPGVICICTLVMILTFGPGTGEDGVTTYTGAAYEGIEVLPKLGDLISPVTKVLFGFPDGSNIDAVAHHFTGCCRRSHRHDSADDYQRTRGSK